MRTSHHFLAAAFAAFVLVLAAGCDSGDDDGAVNIVGTWQRNFAFGGGGAIDFHLTFFEDGTWALGPAGQDQGFQGQYTLDGSTLKVTDFLCDQGEGTYRVRITAGRLVFELVEDPCFRTGIFTASWGRVE